MKTAEDIESYFMRMQLQTESPRPGMWVVHGAPEVENFVISLADTVVVFRMKVMEVPSKQREALFRTLLELNATEMIHGAYGIEGENIVLTDCLQLENLDYNEFQATFDDLSMAVANHYPRLRKYHAAA